MKIKVAIAQFSMPDNYEKCIEKADEYLGDYEPPADVKDKYEIR